MLLLDRPHDFGAAKRLLLPPSYRGSIRQADLLLCVSAASRDRLAAQVPGAESRADVVHLATSSSLRQAVPAPIAALQQRRFALVVGDSSTRKNLTTLMAAWPRVRESHPDAVLAVAGPPNWGGSEVGEQFAALVESGAVVALGYVSDAELRWAYESAAIVLAPSLAEGFGLPAAEALDFGAPVVISDDPALREVCAGRARAVVKALDVDGWVHAITDALSHPPVRDVARSDARTWADVAADTVNSVHRALGASYQPGRHREALTPMTSVDQSEPRTPVLEDLGDSQPVLDPLGSGPSEPPHGSASAVLRGGSWNTGAQLAPLVVNLVMTPYVIHGLGLGRFGLYILATSIADFLGTFDGGVYGSSQRYFAIYAGKNDRRSTAGCAPLCSSS